LFYRTFVNDEQRRQSTISRIVAKEENVARELRAQIIEDDADFYTQVEVESGRWRMTV